MRIIKAELYKLVRRREFFISLCFFMVFSIIFSVLIRFDSNVMEISSQNSISASMFCVFIYQFISSLFGLAIIIGVIVSNIWAGELCDGTISLIILRSRSRGKLYFDKLFASYLCGLIYFVTIILSSSIFYITIGSSSVYYNNNFFDGVEEGFAIFLLFSILYILFLISLTILLAVMLSPMKALLSLIGFLLFLKILEKIDVVKKILPTYLVDAQNIFTNEWGLNDTITTTIIMMTYILVLNTVAYIIFKKKDM